MARAWLIVCAALAEGALGLRVTSPSRRSLVASAASAAAASALVQPAAASKFPQHVEDLDRAGACANHCPLPFVHS